VRRHEAARWTGAYVPYEPAKWFCFVLGAVTLLVVLLAVLFSSPDERPSTIARWARRQPVSFLTAAISELARTSPTAEYGPPYNRGGEGLNQGGEGQHAAFLHPQRWLGIGHPIDTARDFVIDPLRTIPDSKLQREITGYERVHDYLKEDGIHSFETWLPKASVAANGSVKIKPGLYEYVDSMMKALLAFAQSGGLEGYLTGRRVFQADYTKPLLLMTDGGLLRERANGQHLLGDRWPMMNETGSYPGQAWLWPYALWYQIEPFKASHNADILVVLVGAALSLALVCIPFLPGIRDIPRWLPLHRVIWREHYRVSS
jgi:hypothetical protein